MWQLWLLSDTMKHRVHMQDTDKNNFKGHLQSIFKSRTSAFQALNIDCIYSSSSIYGKWYCMKATTCLGATKGVSLSFSRQKTGLSVLKSQPKVAHLCRFFAVLEKCQRTVITDTVGLSCWINDKTPHISPVLTLSLLCFILWEWEYLSSAWLSKKYELKGEKLHLYVSTLQRGWRLVACSFHPVFGGFKFDP